MNFKHLRYFHAVARDGNLTNAVELRRALEDQGAIFSSTMDSEVIVHRIARATGDTPEARVAEAETNLKGSAAYASLVEAAEAGEMMLYRHHGFWQCMDTLRDKNQLEALWESGRAPWKKWA